MKSITVRLPDDQIEKLDETGNRSEAVRNLMASSGVVVAEVPVRPNDPKSNILDGADFSEFAYIPMGTWTKESDAMSKLETYLAAGQAGLVIDPINIDSGASSTFGEHLLASANKISRPSEIHNHTLVASKSGSIGGQQTIDPVILTLMQLSEFYMLSEGDIWQALVLVPLEVGFQDYDFPTGDKGAIREAREFLDEQLDMHTRLEEIWMATNTYGNSYPLEIRSGKRGRLESIVVPNSKHIAIAPQIGVGGRSFFYTPPTESLGAVIEADPSFIYNTGGSAWNEPMVEILGVEINPDHITHFHVPKLPNHIYGIPPIARAIRAVDSRRYLEEMTRATIEGVRNQFWLFKLENPRSGEPQALAAQIAGTRSARTGFLVWSSNLTVEQFIPKSIDDLLANETYRRFTLDVYRRIGISIRMVSGESPDDTSRGDSNVDVDVFLSRTQYARAPYQRYLQRIADEALGGSGKVTIRMADVEMQVAKRIKEKLVPLLNYGIPSVRTTFTMAGFDADQEMEQHRQDDKFRKEFVRPYSGFGQSGPTGNTESEQGRRPPGVVEMEPRQKAEASSLSHTMSASAYDYRIELLEEWERLSREDPDEAKIHEFIAYMIWLAEKYRPDAYMAGYEYGGGIGEIDGESMRAAIAWDAENLQNLEGEMLARYRESKDLAALRHRVLLYASMGWKQAYMGGLWESRTEQGYTGWKRILRPYASKSGPCSVCVADARMIHSMQEPWFDHPNGVCGMAYVQFYHSATPGGVVRIPVIEEE